MQLHPADPPPPEHSLSESYRIIPPLSATEYTGLLHRTPVRVRRKPSSTTLRPEVTRPPSDRRHPVSSRQRSFSRACAARARQDSQSDGQTAGRIDDRSRWGRGGGGTQGRSARRGFPEPAGHKNGILDLHRTHVADLTAGDRLMGPRLPRKVRLH